MIKKKRMCLIFLVKGPVFSYFLPCLPVSALLTFNAQDSYYMYDVITKESRAGLNELRTHKALVAILHLTLVAIAFTQTGHCIKTKLF